MRKFALLFCLTLAISLTHAQQIEVNLTEHADLSYTRSDNDLQKLNLIIPDGIVNPPLLIWVGGGAWAYVNRNKEMDLCRKLASQGIAVASVGHRLSPALIWEPKNSVGIQHPEHIKDVALAFKWIHDHAADYGYDPERIFVGGFSSGAHLSALLALDSRYMEEVGLSTDHIAGAIPVAGAYDIPNYRDQFVTSENPEYVELHIEAVFGKSEEGYLDASPNQYLDNLSVPFLLISETDTYDYTRLFEDELHEASFGRFSVVHAQDLNHAGLWLQLSNDKQSFYRDFIASFIKHSKSPKDG